MTLEDGTNRLSRNVRNYHSTLRNTAEERRCYYRCFTFIYKRETFKIIFCVQKFCSYFSFSLRSVMVSFLTQVCVVLQCTSHICNVLFAVFKIIPAALAPLHESERSRPLQYALRGVHSSPCRAEDVYKLGRLCSDVHLSVKLVSAGCISQLSYLHLS